jgi:effector-binding domain-containing protein
MLSPIKVLTSPAQHTATIRLVVPADAIQNVMGPAIQELYNTLAKQGVPPSGALFCRHFHPPDEEFDFEVGLPVNAPIQAHGRVHPSSLPSTRVVQTVYQGGYERLGDAWEKFDAAIDIGGYEVSEMLWERYVRGPESCPDASHYLTELNRPLR